MNTSHAIVLTHVTRSFVTPEGRVDVLRDISLSVPRGTLIALSGPSGSGKTTLLNLIGGLDQPDAGRIAVLGVDPARLDTEERAAFRRRIGYVFQGFALAANSSAAENVELALRIVGGGPRAEWSARAAQCLAAVGLTAWAHHRPGELSGGQQQRVAIARALVTRPALILADEPTGDLDETTGRQILGLLRAIVDIAGVTVLMATHDPVALLYADRQVELAEGKVQEEG